MRHGDPVDGMSPPTVVQAKRIADTLGARGVVVIAIGGSHVATASYGQTRRECRQVARLSDAIVEGITSGSLPSWETPPGMSSQRMTKDAADGLDGDA